MVGRAKRGLEFRLRNQVSDYSKTWKIQDIVTQENQRFKRIIRMVLCFEITFTTFRYHGFFVIHQNKLLLADKRRCFLSNGFHSKLANQTDRWLTCE